jgi:hypothetical protein
MQLGEVGAGRRSGLAVADLIGALSDDAAN